jgi:hypothetical protein
MYKTKEKFAFLEIKSFWKTEFETVEEFQAHFPNIQDQLYLINRGVVAAQLATINKIKHNWINCDGEIPDALELLKINPITKNRRL